jgi:hypothetical protein
MCVEYAAIVESARGSKADTKPELKNRVEMTKAFGPKAPYK